MSSFETVADNGGLASRGERARAYLRRFFTSWVAEDPRPEYSTLDRADGLGLVPDPVCTPRAPLPESAEVAAQSRHDHDVRDVVGSQQLAVGRVGL